MPDSDPMQDPKAHTAACWRPDADDHCCGLRNPDGTWRVPGLASAASLDSREAMAWNYAVVAAEEQRDRALVEVARLRAELAEARAVGRCGAAGPVVYADAPLSCSLPAGHLGWHKDAETGAEWTP